MKLFKTPFTLLLLACFTSLFAQTPIISQKSEGKNFPLDREPTSHEILSGNLVVPNSHASKTAVDYGPTPDWDWVKRVSGSAGDHGAGLATNAAGDRCVVGEYSGETDFGSGSVTSSGIKEPFVAKWSTTGSLEWVTTFAGDPLTKGTALSVNIGPSGNIYVAGEFVGPSLAIGPTVLSNSGEKAMFVACLDSLGTPIWAKEHSAAGEVYSGKEIQIDGAGNVYVMDHYFLRKYDASGNYQWEITNQGKFLDLATLEDGIYISGEAYGDNVNGILTNGFFLARINPGGTFDWLISATAVSTQTPAYSVAADPVGAVYIAGEFYQDINFGGMIYSPGSISECFLAKIDTSGSIEWFRQFNSGGNYSYASDLFVNSSGNVVFTGLHYADLTVDSVTLAGNNLFFMLTFDTSGNAISGMNFPNEFSLNLRKAIAGASDNILHTGNLDRDIYSTETSPSGTTIWEKHTSGDGGHANTGWQVDVDQEGHTFVHGASFGNVDHFGIASDFKGFYTAKLDLNGDAIWVKEMLSGTGNSAYGVSNTSDGGCVVWGAFGDSLDLGTISLVETGGYWDGYLVRYDSDGNLLWANQFLLSSAGGIQGWSGLDVDADGNILIAGSFRGTLEIGGTILTYENLTEDIFAAKFSSSGTLTWAKHWVSPSGSRAQARTLITDPTGNVYVAGNFYNSLDLGSSTINDDGGYLTGFLVKLDPGGDIQWAETMAPEADFWGNATAIGTDGLGNLCVSGWLWDFSGGAYPASFGTETLNSQYSSIFVAKYDDSGNAQWVKTIDATENLFSAYQAGMDAEGGCYVGGTFLDNSISFGSGINLIRMGNAHDMFIAKYDPIGEVEWVKSIETTMDDPEDISSNILGISLFDTNKVVISGHLNNNLAAFGTITVATGSGGGFVGAMGGPFVTFVTPEIGDQTLSLFPNPASEWITLESSRNFSGKVQVELVDFSGRVVMDRTSAPEGNRLQMPLPELAEGTYIVRVSGKGFFQAGKLMLKKK